MTFLLDTCVVSEFGKPRAHPGLVDWLAAQPESSLFLSTITVGEIKKGIASVRQEVRRQRLRTFLEGAVIDRFRGRIVETNEAVWRRWGALAGAAERRGQPLPVIDGLLAAVALTHGLTVVTRNEADFARCEVPLVNPWR